MFFFRWLFFAVSLSLGLFLFSGLEEGCFYRLLYTNSSENVSRFLKDQKSSDGSFSYKSADHSSIQKPQKFKRFDDKNVSIYVIQTATTALS